LMHDRRFPDHHHSPIEVLRVGSRLLVIILP